MKLLFCYLEHLRFLEIRTCKTTDELRWVITRGEFRPRQTRQLPRAVDLKGRLLSFQSYYLLPPPSIHLQSDIQ